MKNSLMLLILGLLPRFLFGDILRFPDGKVLENVKVKVGKETVEIHYENGKKEVRQKNDLKKIKIKLAPVSWNQGDKPQKPTINQKPLTNQKLEAEEKPTTIREKVSNEFSELARQRDTNFPLSVKVAEERKMHEPLMKERFRLQFTEGMLTYSGGQVIFTEIMEKNNDRYYVKNKFGLFYFTTNDFGEEMVIDTDNGKEEIPISKIAAVKEEKYLDGFVYLKGGEKFRGSIIKNLGSYALVKRNEREIKINSADILFPKIPKVEQKPAEVKIKEGDKGKFLFSNGESIEGRLIRLSPNYLFIETNFGVLEMALSNFVSIEKSEEKK